MSIPGGNNGTLSKLILYEVSNESTINSTTSKWEAKLWRVCWDTAKVVPNQTGDDHSETNKNRVSIIRNKQGGVANLRVLINSTWIIHSSRSERSFKTMLHPVVFTQKWLSTSTKTYVDTERDPEVTTDLLIPHDNPIIRESVKVFEGRFTHLMSKWVPNTIPHAMLTITGRDTGRSVRKAKTVRAGKSIVHHTKYKLVKNAYTHSTLRQFI